MNDLLNTLEQNRDLILLAEIGAMLHDIGKLSPGFIVGVLDDKTRREKYPDKDHPKSLHPGDVLQADESVIESVMSNKVNQPLAQALSSPVNAAAANLLNSVSLADFIARHHLPPGKSVNQLPDLLRLVVIADKRDSGEDEYTAMDARQRTNVYGATVFGYEADPIDTSDFDKARREVWEALAEVLQSTDDWGKRRDEFMRVLAKKLSLTRGKTQRMANDITLYQHSRAVGTRFKAYLARDLVDTTRQGQKEFRLLNVAWDAWRFSVHVPRLSDAAGRRDLIEEFKERVRRLVELEYPLGNVIYHDDSTLVALVADLEVEDDLRAKIERLARDSTDGEIIPVVRLSPHTTRVTDVVAQELKARQIPPRGEIPPWAAEWTGRKGSVICPVCGHRPLRSNDDPHCDWCGQVRRRGVRRRLGEERETDAGEIPHLLPALVGGARHWLEEERGTVWMGEIADRNGRLALLVGRFSLDRWLDGKLLYTALITSSRGRAQARGWGDYPTCSLVGALEACVQDPDTLSGLVYPDNKPQVKAQAEDRAKALRRHLGQAQRKLESVRTNPQIPESVRPQRIQAMEERLQQVKAQVEPELASLQGALLVRDVFEQYERETDQRLRSAATELPADWRLVERYAAVLARKNPSAARLFRVWETTGDFFMRAVPEAVNNLFDEDRTKPPHEQRYRHLWGESECLRFDLSDIPRKLRAGIYTVAMVNRDGQRYETEVFFSRERGERPSMITINRLSAEDRTWLEGCEDAGHVQVIARETGRKEPRSELLSIRSVTSEDYLPYHVLTTSPEMLVAILPAEIAPQIAQHIQATYEREMGKVMSRLPLYLGLFFMDKHFPMFVALDTARRAAELSDHLGDVTETWRVHQTPAIATNATGDQVYRLVVQPEPGSDGQARSTYALEIPYQLGNGEPDYYHPYFIVSQAATGFPLEERSTHLRTPAGHIVHVSELQANDRLQVYPNRFDFLFLDTVARRFDVRIDEETGRRPHQLFGPRHSPRPYYLEDLRRMEQVWQWCWPAGMTNTRLHGIRDLLAARFGEWNLAEKERTANEWRTYEKLIAQVLGKEFSVYVPESPAYEGLRQAMLDGLFFDCLELHLQILKEKGVQQ